MERTSGTLAALEVPLAVHPQCSILARLGEPDSAAGLAKAFGLPRQRVGYHVAVKDRFSSAYLVAMASQSARDVFALQERAGQAGQRLATLTLDAEVRFASPSAQQASAEELAEAFKKLVAKHRDEEAPGGRRFRFLIVGHPGTRRGRASAGTSPAGKEEASDA